MTISMKKLMALTLFVLSACRCDDDRFTCRDCMTACQPFAVATCEPTTSRFSPAACGCDPYRRGDDPAFATGTVTKGATK